MAWISAVFLTGKGDMTQQIDREQLKNKCFILRHGKTQTSQFTFTTSHWLPSSTILTSASYNRSISRMTSFFKQCWCILDPFRLWTTTNTARTISGEMLVSDITPERPYHIHFLNIDAPVNPSWSAQHGDHYYIRIEWYRETAYNRSGWMAYWTLETANHNGIWSLIFNSSLGCQWTDWMLLTPFWHFSSWFLFMSFLTGHVWHKDGCLFWNNLCLSAFDKWYCSIKT